MRKILSFLPMLVLGITLAVAQTGPITGRVVDENGQPVTGASVLIKGTSSGASADANGNFKISAKPGDVLVISAIGIPSKEVSVTSNANITISLARQSQNLSEVVVTALGIRRSKNTLPYAAQQVSGEDVSR